MVCSPCLHPMSALNPPAITDLNPEDDHIELKLRSARYGANYLPRADERAKIGSAFQNEIVDVVNSPR